MNPGGAGGGGGVLWYVHPYLGSGHFSGFKILNFNIFWVLLKNEYFEGMRFLWILFWGHLKIGPYLEVVSMHLGSFLKVGIFFPGLLKFQTFFGVLEIPDFFGVNGRCRAGACAWRKNQSTPPPPPPPGRHACRSFVSIRYFAVAARLCG